jgi:hypothetical protein
MRSVRYVGHLGGIVEERAYRVIAGDVSERSHLEKLGIDKVKLLKPIFERQNRAKKWTGFVLLSYLQMGSCEYVNEQFVLQNEGKFLTS